MKSAPDTTKKNLILIDHFGKLIEDKQGTEAVKWISNGLQLRIDSTFIYGDSAVIYGEDRLEAFGNVIIQQGDSLEVFTDTLYYTGETDIAELKGEVVLKQGTKQLWTTDLTYHLDERYGEYHRHGTLVDKDLQVTSVSGVYNADREEVQFRDSVFVLHPEFSLAADSMRYNAGEGKVLFTGPTNIYTDHAQIYCESGYYQVEQGEAKFSQNAQYMDGTKLGTADDIYYWSNRDEVLLTGFVQVDDGAQHIRGDSLLYNERTGETRISGKPGTYVDSTRQMTASVILYNEKTKALKTSGRGVIRDGDLNLASDNFVFDEMTGKGIADGNVIWRDTVNNLGILSDTVRYSKKEGLVLAYGGIRPMFFTVMDGDTLFLAADTLHMWTEVDTVLGDSIRMIRAFRDVRLFKSDLQGRTDSLVFQGRDSVFTFYGRPLLWSDSTQFRADTMFMHLKDGKLKTIDMVRNALIISEILRTYYDQIKGRMIVAEFDSSEIRDMHVSGNAESIYYTRDEHDAFIGVNKTICSKMHFTFVEKQIEHLTYYGDNSSTMFPMHDVNHSTLRLEGFEWRIEERPWSIADLLK